MITEDQLLLQQQIILATGNQVSVQDSVALFREQLAVYIHELINGNFEKLISILYRLDINEKKLKSFIATQATTDAGTIIAETIIERQLQKVVARKKYRTPDTGIPDEEKW